MATKISPEIEKIWKEYKNAKTSVPRLQDLRNRLVETYLYLVKYISERIASKLPPSVDVADLQQAGVFGLMDAIDGFDLSRGIKFETYCAIRIRGAILDELRKNDWVPRQVRQRKSKLDQAYRACEAELGRMPTETELAGKMGMTSDDFDALVREASAATLVSLNRKWGDDDDNKEIRKIDIIEDKKMADPVEILHKQEVMDFVTKNLTRKERLVILLYYYEELTMKEIGLTLDLSESRVCQLHSRILTKLQYQMSKSERNL